MLNENIKKLRKSGGLFQEELTIRLNAVRQTVLERENGLPVPDSSTLVVLMDELDTPVDVLPREPVTESMPDGMRTISEKLEVINLQLAQRSADKMKAVCRILISLCTLVITMLLAFVAMQNSYLGQNYNNPELAVVGITLHGRGFVFVRFASVTFTVRTIGIVAMCKKR